MPAARIPENDAARIAALHSLQILDTPPEAVFDRFTRLASALLDTPASAISLVDGDRQWLKSAVGLPVGESPRDSAFCGYTILGTQPLVIEDAEADPRVSDNAFVTGDPHIRFYAGAPLLTRDGHAIGALCAIDTRPRTVTRTQVAGLTHLAQSLMETLEARSMDAAIQPVASPAEDAAGPAPEPQTPPNPADLHLAIEAMSQGISMFDGKGALILCNSRFAELYRLPPALTQPGTSLREIAGYGHACGNFANMTREEAMHWLDGVAMTPKLSETDIELRDGRIIAVRRHPVAGGGFVATHDDITMRRMAEARVVHMARHDGLTDLPNRIAFNERLVQSFAHAARGKSFAVLCLDLDGFKRVNDTGGHGAGDKLLIAVGKRIQGCIREVDLLARLGGDEFAVILDGIEAVSEITATCERIIEAISRPFSIEGSQVSVGVSIGVATAPQDGMDGSQLLRNADLALYLAKSEGKGTFRFFEPEIDACTQLRRSLEADLAEAAATGAFEVHYQPLVNLASRRVSGLEALLRWNHPARGWVPPAEYIPVAEETGLITAIGAFVLRQACMDAAKWPDGIRIAVNVSAAQFRTGHLFDTVRDALRQAHLRPGRLELEITETVMMTRNQETVETLQRLRGLGVRIVLDDFGTGYSSLSHLNSFPFDGIKIDQSFIRDLPQRDDLACIVGAVARMGAGLGMSTTAEGIETSAELDRLMQEGCTEGQGFLFSPARPAADIPRLIRQIGGHPAHAVTMADAA